MTRTVTCSMMEPNDDAGLVLYTTRSRYACEATWNQHRQLISSLYRSKTLAQVMSIMDTEHGFKATPKMYKARFEKWGIATKNRRPQKRRTKQDSPNQSASYDISEPEVVSSDKTKTLARSKVATYIFNTAGDSTLETLKAARYYSTKLLETDPRRGQQAMLSSLFDDSAEVYILMRTLVAATARANNFFTHGLHSEAEMILVIALAPLNRILASKFYEMLPCLLVAITGFWWDEKHPYRYLTKELVKHVYRMCEKILPANHPLAFAFSRLVTMKPDEFGHALESLSESSCDTLDMHLGPRHLFSVVRRSHLMVDYCRLHPEVWPAYVRRLRDWISDRESYATLSDQNLRFHAVQILTHVGALDEAEQLAIESQALLLKESDEAPNYMNGWWNERIGQIKMAQGDAEAAYQHFMDAAGIYDWTFERANPVVMNLFLRLEKCLVACGRDEEARAVREERVGRLKEAYLAVALP